MEAKQALAKALNKIFAEMNVAAPAKLVIEEPREASFGDLSTNAALLLAKEARQKPRDLAAKIAAQLKAALPQIAKAEVAGPGFINITFEPDTWREVIAAVETAGPHYGHTTAGKGRKTLVEYVSANPTGPLHVGHGRGAALGDSVARLLKAAGYDVATEYYLNDAGRQMRTLGLSIWLRAKEKAGEKVDFPSDCYQGDYIKDLAAALLDKKPDLTSLPEDAGVEICKQYGTEQILADIRSDLDRFGCGIDSFAPESALMKNGSVTAALQHLHDAGKSYEADGALWLNTAENGDAKNRVLRKSDGSLTYFATDIAYHHDKYRRGHDWLIDVWGADHHGYIPRMRAAISHMGHDPDQFSVLLVQLVNLLRNGEAVSMSTRSGEFVTLDEVLNEVGTDAARFMFLSRSPDSPLDFDLELAKKRTLDNPVYYVQYAHARVQALMRRAADNGIMAPDRTEPEILAYLDKPEEMAILRHMAAFDEVVAAAAKNLAPHLVSSYLLDLAGLLHSYYAKHKVLDKDCPQASLARLALLKAAGQVLRNGLELLGVSAPETM